MATDVPLYEHAESRSPGAAGFGMEGGRASLPFWADHTQMKQSVLTVVGDVSSRGDGCLKRSLPLKHPEFPFLSASRLANIEGVGAPAPVYSTAAQPLDNVPEQFGDYPERNCTVEFDAKPYALIPDKLINYTFVDWADSNGLPSPYRKTTNEWRRFTSWERTPSPEMITAQQGAMYLARDAANLKPVGTPPQGYQFVGQPRIWWPKTTLKVMWWWVPAQWLNSPNSYLQKHQMKVNLFPWIGYDPGQILYVGCTPKSFQPVWPEQIDNINDATVYSVEQILILELTFVLTRIPSAGTLTTPPLFAPRRPTDAGNANAVWNGHNLAPSFYDRQYYPVVTPNPTNVNDTTLWRPVFDACPMEQLFADPDRP